MGEIFTTENRSQNLEFADSLVREDISRLKEILIKPVSTTSTTEEVPWDLMDILVDVTDPEINKKLSQDPEFKKRLAGIVKKIKKYFHNKEKSYEIKVFVWHDAEDNEWVENMIKVKTPYKDPDEHMKIWWDLQNLLSNREKEIITVLLED